MWWSGARRAFNKAKKCACIALISHMHGILAACLAFVYNKLMKFLRNSRRRRSSEKLRRKRSSRSLRLLRSRRIPVSEIEEVIIKQQTHLQFTWRHIVWPTNNPWPLSLLTWVKLVQKYLWKSLTQISSDGGDSVREIALLMRQTMCMLLCLHTDLFNTP